MFKKALATGLFILCLSQSASAIGSNSECRALFNDAYSDLSSYVSDFNSGYMDKQDFAMQVGLLSTAVTANKYVCMMVADATSLECSKAYETRYKALRDEIRLGAIISGNQKEVSVSVLRRISRDFTNSLSKLRCGDL